MTITFPCTGCSKKYRADSANAGKQMKCRDCGTVFRIPTPRGHAAPGPGGTASRGAVAAPSEASAVDSHSTRPRPAPARHAAASAPGRAPSQGNDEVVQCTSCGADCRILAEWRGKPLECPTCKNRFVVPGRDRTAPTSPAAAFFTEDEDDAAAAAATPFDDDDLMPADEPIARSTYESTLTRSKPSAPWSMDSGAIAKTLFGLVVVGLLVAAPFSPGAALALFVVGLSSYVGGGLWMLVVAFQESVWCGLACMFVPFYSLYYLISRWADTWRPFVTGLAGLFLIFVGHGFNFYHNPDLLNAEVGPGVAGPVDAGAPRVGEAAVAARGGGAAHVGGAAGRLARPSGKPDPQRLVIPGAEPNIPAWCGRDRDEPFQVRQLLETRAAPAENAAPLYLTALADIDPDMEFVFPPDQRAARATQVRAIHEVIQRLADEKRMRSGGVREQELEELFAAVAPALEAVDRAQARPRCVFVTGLRFDSELPHAQAARRLAQLSQLQMYHAASKQDFAAVEQALKRSLRLSRDLRPRGPSICQFVSVAMDAVVLNTMLDYVLNRKELSAEHCDRLAALLLEHRRDALDLRSEGLRMDYVMARNSIEELQGGRLTVKQIADTAEDPTIQQLNVRQVKWDSEIALLNSHFAGIVAALGKPARDTSTTWFDNEFAKLKGGRSLVTVILAPDAGSMHEVDSRTEARLGATLALIAVRRYELSQGAVPADLEAACQAAPGVKAVPADPYDGRPLRYKVIAGKPVVYSVGSDRSDDGGQKDWNLGKSPGDFIFTIGSPAAERPTAAARRSGPLPEDSKVLLQELDSPHGSTRREAVQVLARMKPDENRAAVVRRLEELLKDGDHTVQGHALEALASWSGSESTLAVKQLLRTTSSAESKTKAMEFLARFADDSMVDDIADVLSDFKSNSLDVRSILERFGPVGEKVAVKILSTSRAWVFTRRDVAKFVESNAKKHPLRPESVAAIMDIVRNESDHDTVRPLIGALGTVKEARVADLLITGLDDIWYVKESKAALVAMGPAAETSVVKLLKHQNPAMRITCCEILSVIGTRKSLSALRPLVANNPVGQAARAAVDAINQRAKDEPTP